MLSICWCAQQTVQDTRYIHHNKLYKIHGTYITTNCTRYMVRTSK